MRLQQLVLGARASPAQRGVRVDVFGIRQQCLEGTQLRRELRAYEVTEAGWISLTSTHLVGYSPV